MLVIIDQTVLVAAQVVAVGAAHSWVVGHFHRMIHYSLVQEVMQVVMEMLAACSHYHLILPRYFGSMNLQ